MNPHRLHVPVSLHRPALAALTALTLLAASPAQVPDPVGRIHPAAQPLADIATLVVPGLDRTSIAAEDQQRRRNGQPARYAIPHAVTASPATHGTWQSLDATWSLWRLRVQAPGANHINLGFRRFQLPAGARVQIYSSDYSDLVRPFDVADHQPTLDLWTPVCGTEEIVVELYVMEAQRPQVQLELQQVGSGYRFFGAGSDALLPVGRGNCNIDVTCPLGATWAQEIPAVAAISSAGSIFCSGAMINNTAQDGRNFFLTANHCSVTPGVASSLVCYWNYRNTTCGGSDANLLQFTTGATFRSTSTATDFTLLELNQTPNAAWGVSYLGWNRGTGDTTSATAIHHPSGEPKKISFEYQATTTTSYSGTAVPGNGTHLRITDWDDGTTEGGSSGSPLFDQNKRVVAQLHGGSAACGNDFSDWYGRFSGSWTGGGTDATRLSNWLDPLNTGALTLNTRLPASSTVAAATSYGAGCYDTQGAFAQTFAISTFDLSGSPTSTVGRSFVPIANGFTVQAGPNVWFTPLSADLGLGDDAVSVALSLPFGFNFPGGSTAQVRMCSNGYLWLNGTSITADLTPTAAELASGPARFAPAWMDLNPAQGGSCHYDVDPSNTAVYFTWNNVPHYTSGTAGAGNTFQVVLRSNGSAEFRWRSVPNQIGDCVVGWSRGASATPADRDLSASGPFQVTVDASALTFAPVNRPILGATQTINLTNVPNPVASTGLVLIGFAPVSPALNLVSIGAPGCFLHAPSTVIQVLFPLGVSTPWNLVIPNNPSLANSHVYVQGAALVPPGTNAFGLLTANGVDLLLGTL